MRIGHASVGKAVLAHRETWDGASAAVTGAGHRSPAHLAGKKEVPGNPSVPGRSEGKPPDLASFRVRVPVMNSFGANLVPSEPHVATLYSLK